MRVCVLLALPGRHRPVPDSVLLGPSGGGPDPALPGLLAPAATPLSPPLAAQGPRTSQLRQSTRKLPRTRADLARSLQEDLSDQPAHYLGQQKKLGFHSQFTRLT